MGGQLILFHTFYLLLSGRSIACNVKVLCAVGDFGDGIFNLLQKPDRSTNVQLTTIAPIAQNTCYGLPFQDNALGELSKTHNLL